MNSKLFEGIDFVEHLQKYYSPPNVFYIAGGAVRDFLNEKEISDIDIYATLDRKYYHSETQRMRLISNIMDKYTIYNWKYQTNKYIDRSVLTINLFNSIDIDIIFTNNPVLDICNFDIGLCKVYLDNKFNLHMTEEYKKDLENKTLTFYPLCLTHAQILRSVTYHIPKLAKKYPEHKLVISYE